MSINFDLACRDDCLDLLVPSDLRQLVAERDRAQQRTKELQEKNAELVNLVTEAYFEGWDDSDNFGDEKKFDTASHFWLDSVSRNKCAVITRTTKEQPQCAEQLKVDKDSK